MRKKKLQTARKVKRATRKATKGMVRRSKRVSHKRDSYQQLEDMVTRMIEQASELGQSEITFFIGERKEEDVVTLKHNLKGKGYRVNHQGKSLMQSEPKMTVFWT